MKKKYQNILRSDVTHPRDSPAATIAAIIKGCLVLKYLQNKRKTLAYLMRGWKPAARVFSAINCMRIWTHMLTNCLSSASSKKFHRVASGWKIFSKAIKPHLMGNSHLTRESRNSKLSPVCPRFVAFHLKAHFMTFPLKMTLKVFSNFSRTRQRVSTFVAATAKPRKLINNNETTSQYLCYLFNCSINNNLVSSPHQQRSNKNIFECIFYRKSDEDST